MVQDLRSEDSETNPWPLLVLLSAPPDADLPAAPLEAFKYIFLTSSGHRGNLDQLPGGPTEANRVDALCAADSKPRPGTYRALISTGPGDRQACSTANCSGGASEHFDWVLSPDTEYRRPDGAVLARTQTTIGLFDVGGFQNSLASFYAAYWTGLNPDWTYGGAAATCNGWNSNSLGTGLAGFSDRTDTGAYAGGAQPCGASLRIACVEQ